MSVDDRARIRTEVATELFTAEHGRPPADARELSATIARHSRPRTTAVAGFDLTFSPPKSVSTLWAVADPASGGPDRTSPPASRRRRPPLRRTELLYSREGARGVRQVEVEGLVAAAFTHRDTRAGDPDLHTHVAVANKVKTLGSGKWLAIDGRVLYQGVRRRVRDLQHRPGQAPRRSRAAFYDRPAADPRGRPVREIVGVSPELNRRWSTRRADIEIRREQLVTDFQARHGRPPSPVESIKLAQQATLETRDAKHAPRTLAEQRATWHAQAVRTLGGRGALADDQPGVSPAAGPLCTRRRGLVRTVRRPDRHRHAGPGATWNDAHLRAEAQRLIRRADVTLQRPRPRSTTWSGWRRTGRCRWPGPTRSPNPHHCAAPTGPASTPSPAPSCSPPPPSWPPNRACSPRRPHRRPRRHPDTTVAQAEQPPNPPRSADRR